LKKDEDADTAKRAMSASRDFVFGIRHLRRRVCLIRSGIGRQQLSGAFELESAGRAEDAVIADFGRAVGQDVLNKPMDELDAGKGEVANLMRSIVGIAKTNPAIIDGFDPAVGDRDAEEVACQILKDLVATARRLGMDDPFLLP